MSITQLDTFASKLTIWPWGTVQAISTWELNLNAQMYDTWCVYEFVESLLLHMPVFMVFVYMTPRHSPSKYVLGAQN